MEQIMTSMYNLLDKWTPLVWILVVIALAVIGVMMICGEKAREKAKEWFPWVIIGCGLVLGATLLGKEIAAAFVF